MAGRVDSGTFNIGLRSLGSILYSIPARRLVVPSGVVVTTTIVLKIHLEFPPAISRSVVSLTSSLVCTVSRNSGPMFSSLALIVVAECS